MTILISFFVCLSVLTINLSTSQVMTTESDLIPLCSSEPTDNGEVIVNCSCSLDNGVLIIQDTSLSYGNDTTDLDNSTTHWILSDCSELHFSGSTLLSLENLHTLELHNIKNIHIDAQFFSKYNTQLQVLEIHNSNFSTLEGSLNILAQKFKRIILDKMYMTEIFNLLIHTKEGHSLDLITLQNCHISVLGDINISSRSVNQFSLENNIIGTVMSGSILHTNTTTISDNTFGDLHLLSMDISTRDFILRNNTFETFIKYGMQVDNASSILITENTFSYIEENSFIFLRTKLNNGSFTFTENHFYKYERGSLQFNHLVFNRHLLIALNAIHTPTCDCHTLDAIEDLTEAHNKTTLDFHKHRYMTYELLKETSACIDDNGVEKSTMILCNDPSSTTLSWVAPTISLVALTTIITIIVILVKSKQMCSRKQKENPYDYSVNMGYMDDSETEEYVR